MLDDIIRHKRAEIAEAKRTRPLEKLEAEAESQSAARGFADALRSPGVSLIAEIKRASPSKGDFAPDLCAKATAETYARCGASALSVLTDRRFFRGGLDDLREARGALERIGRSIPILRKDFLLDPYQIVESRAAGADAVLLIVRILSDDEIATFHRAADALGMDALVEVCDEKDIARIEVLAPPLVGINQRNLSDFSVDRSTFARLRRLLPDETLVVAASGIRTADDVADVAHAHADAILVGEALVTANDHCRKVQELTGGTA